VLASLQRSLPTYCFYLQCHCVLHGVEQADGTYEVYIDQQSVRAGKLEDDFDFLEPRTIKDPDASKPEASHLIDSIDCRAAVQCRSHVLYSCCSRLPITIISSELPSWQQCAVWQSAVVLLLAATL
jgi:hypothetical protein